MSIVDARLAQRKLRAPLLENGRQNSACRRRGPRRCYLRRGTSQRLHASTDAQGATERPRCAAMPTALGPAFLTPLQLRRALAVATPNAVGANPARGFAPIPHACKQLAADACTALRAGDAVRAIVNAARRVVVAFAAEAHRAVVAGAAVGRAGVACSSGKAGGDGGRRANGAHRAARAGRKRARATPHTSICQNIRLARFPLRRLGAPRTARARAVGVTRPGAAQEPLRLDTPGVVSASSRLQAR
jgi:hypothetical protein